MFGELKAMAGDEEGAGEAAGPVVTRVLKDQILHLTKRKHDMFVSNHGMRPQDVEAARKLRVSVKTRDDYWAVKDLPPPPGATAAKPDAEGDDAVAKAHLKQKAVQNVHEREAQNAAGGGGESGAAGGPAGQLALYKPQGGSGHSGSTQLMVRAGKTLNMPKPEWHAPWKLMRVISGHLGWVRCIHFEPGNEWFATGAGDRTVKIWDLASGDLKVSRTVLPTCHICLDHTHSLIFRMLSLPCMLVNFYSVLRVACDSVLAHPGTDIHMRN